MKHRPLRANNTRESVRARAAEEERALPLPSPAPREHYPPVAEAIAPASPEHYPRAVSIAARTLPPEGFPQAAPALAPASTSVTAPAPASPFFHRTPAREALSERAPPLPGTRVTTPSMSPQEDAVVNAAITGELPVYPRQSARFGKAHRGAAAAGGLPLHPRQDARTGSAHRAVFEALARLLPAPPTEAAARRDNFGRRLGAAAGGGARRMQAAALRCGSQCQGYIRLLQQGVQVRDLF